MNYRMVAYRVGDLLKYATTQRGIERAARSVFSFSKESFPVEGISSVRAQDFLDWVLTLAKQEMTSDERNRLLVQFVLILTPIELKEEVEKIIQDAEITTNSVEAVSRDFTNRNYHEVIHQHCRKLFAQENYFHAVFEAAKVYNRLVQQKAQNEKDGQSLMLEVFSVNGTLKLNKGITQTEKNVQDGVKFLSAGLMQAMRNPTAHEPALDWPITKEECLDMLSFISYLLRQFDKAVYVAPHMSTL